MTGFQYLLASSVMIAFASIVSVNYYSWSSDMSWRMFISLQGVCLDDNLRRFLPMWFECQPYIANEHLFDPTAEERIHKFRQSDWIVQIEA